ncbi:KICSTOR complex protein kaptin-like [Haliotis rufescens]|uniref:KICSTOR complex protein kaptin-like n=1 Tax=Haliotis rufescens TaxID=6454 RepID=UPI001EAFCB58|nr:KICSTOR complex protein kaptin-like [Haliotis rufescens]
MGDRGWRWTDAHFCSLPSQTNVYGLTRITDSEGNNKLLVASLDGKVIAVEYQTFNNRLTPCTKEIQFTYIPGDAEIVSVDVLRRCQGNNGIIVGITFLKLQEDEKECKPASQFLNLYSASEVGDEANLDIVAQGCLSLELNFIPYQLLHTELLDDDSKEMVFLLSGGDNKIHMYRESFKSHGFQETPSEEFFPEFNNIPSSVLQLSISYLDNYKRRLTVMGHQNGLVQVAYVNVTAKEVLISWSTEHDSPITSIRLFTAKNHVACPSFLDFFNEESAREEEEQLANYNLLVTSALEPAVVYRNVLITGFEDILSLPNSEKFDSTLCSCVVDIDFDGENELLVGTYGQELLAYKYFEENQHFDTDRKYSLSDITIKAGSSQSNTPSHTSSTPERTLNQLEELNKQRHRSDESNSQATSVKDAQPTRKAKSQEDLFVSGHGVKEEQVQLEEDVQPPFNPAGFQLLWQRSFPGPVVGLDRLDIMGDGMDDLVVVTLKGMHILQPDLGEVAEVCRERLRGLCDSSSEPDDAYHNLQKETFGR